MKLHPRRTLFYLDYNSKFYCHWKVFKEYRSSPVVYLEKDLVLSVLWCGFSPWLKNLHVPQVGPKKERRTQLNA